MSSYYSHGCDRRAYTVIASGPREFYRDAQGQRRPYGHPIPASQKARERGTARLAANLYGPEYDRVSNRQCRIQDGGEGRPISVGGAPE